MFCGTVSLEMMETRSYRSDQSSGSSIDFPFAPGTVSLDITDTAVTPRPQFFNAGEVIPRVCKKLSFTKLSSMNSSLTTTAHSVTESCELCAICLSEILVENGNEYIITDCCEHKFHNQCISRWKKEQTRCPLCRAGLSEEQGEREMVQAFPSFEMLRVIINYLTRENQNPVSTKEAIANIVLAPFGLVWVALIIALIWCAETLCFCLVTPLVICRLLMEGFNECQNRVCYYLSETFCMCMYLTVVTFALAGPAIIFLFCQFLMLICCGITFCFKVCRCQRRWQDAFPHMARQVIIF